MYKKTYGMNAVNVSTIVNVNGEPQRIEFTGGVTDGYSKVMARYKTTNSAIQKAIESDPRFGETIFTVSITEIKKKEKVVKNGNVKEFKYIRTMQDAINVLATQYGVDLNSIKNKADLKAAAEKKKVSFPNLR